MNTPDNASGQIQHENMCSKEDRQKKAGPNGVHAMEMLEEKESYIAADILEKMKEYFSPQEGLNKTDASKLLLSYVRLTEGQLKVFLSKMEPYFYSLDILPELRCTEEKREIDKERLILGMENEIAKMLLSQEAPVNIAMHDMRESVVKIIEIKKEMNTVKNSMEEQVKILEKKVIELLKVHGIAAQYVENFSEFNGDNVWAKQATMAMPGKDLAKAQNIIQKHFKEQGISDLRLITHLFADNEDALVGCYIG